MAEGQPYFMILLILSVAVSFVFPVMTVIHAPYSYLGIVAVGFGIIMDLWSSSLFVKSKTTVSPYGSPTSLVISGPFRISRNPMYLGMAAMLAGIAILLGTLVAFAFPIIFILIIEVRLIPEEERKMEKIFGEQYRDYKSKTVDMITLWLMSRKIIAGM
jgi:protein-S-isoprenylcysteine O-methyltransferase Ste14